MNTLNVDTQKHILFDKSFLCFIDIWPIKSAKYSFCKSFRKDLKKYKIKFYEYYSYQDKEKFLIVDDDTQSEISNYKSKHFAIVDSISLIYSSEHCCNIELIQALKQNAPANFIERLNFIKENFKIFNFIYLKIKLKNNCNSTYILDLKKFDIFNLDVDNNSYQQIFDLIIENSYLENYKDGYIYFNFTDGAVKREYRSKSKENILEFIKFNCIDRLDRYRKYYKIEDDFYKKKITQINNFDETILNSNFTFDRGDGLETVILHKINY